MGITVVTKTLLSMELFIAANLPNRLNSIELNNHIR